jgi:hypothetical protein
MHIRKYVKEKIQGRIQELEKRGEALVEFQGVKLPRSF